MFLTRSFHPSNFPCFHSNVPASEPFTTVTPKNGGEEFAVLPDYCVQGTYGAEFHSGLHINPHDIIIDTGLYPDMEERDIFSSHNNDFESIFKVYLKLLNITEVVVAG